MNDSSMVISEQSFVKPEKKTFDEELDATAQGLVDFEDKMELLLELQERSFAAKKSLTSLELRALRL